MKLDAVHQFLALVGGLHIFGCELRFPGHEGHRGRKEERKHPSPGSYHLTGLGKTVFDTTRYRRLQSHIGNRRFDLCNLCFSDLGRCFAVLDSDLRAFKRGA